MLQKWKLTKINFTKPHENITYKGSNKANDQHHKAICNRYYICNNTDMFSQSLESQTDFIISSMVTIENGVQHMHTHYSELHLTLMKTEKTDSVTLETQVSLTTHTFDICFLLCLFLFVTFFTFYFSFLGHNSDNRMHCEHPLLFLNKRNISIYIKICKLPNQLCCKV